MFLCRTGRLSAAALDQAFKSPGSFLVQVTANRQRDLSLSLRKDHASQWDRFFCASVGGVDSTLVYLGKQRLDPQPFQKWDSSSGFVIAEWRHLDCVNTIAAHLSKNAQTESCYLDIIRQPLVGAKRRHISRGERVGYVLFKGNWGVSSYSTRTMQLRASSTAAGTKKSEEHTTDNNKGVNKTIPLHCTVCLTPSDQQEHTGTSLCPQIDCVQLVEEHASGPLGPGGIRSELKTINYAEPPVCSVFSGNHASCAVE